MLTNYFGIEMSFFGIEIISIIMNTVNKNQNKLVKKC